MRERGMLFSGLMMRAMFAELKTETRRVVVPQPILFSQIDKVWAWKKEYDEQRLRQALIDSSPYGQRGDRLWTRETFLLRENGKCAIYRADFDPVEAAGIGAMYGGWKPSIHQPRWASRGLLEIEQIGAERVQDIDEPAALREGMVIYQHEPGHAEFLAAAVKVMVNEGHNVFTIRDVFRRSWSGINAQRGYGWHENPWVRVVRYKVLEIKR